MKQEFFTGILLTLYDYFYLLQYTFEEVISFNIQLFRDNIFSLGVVNESEKFIYMLISNISNIFFLSGFGCLFFTLCLYLINLIFVLLVPTSPSRLLVKILIFENLNFFILSQINYYLFILQCLNSIIIEKVIGYASSNSTILLNFVKKSRVFFKI